MLCEFIKREDGGCFCSRCLYQASTCVDGQRRMCAAGFQPHSCFAGAALRELLNAWPFRIVATPDCKCTSRAAYMDAKGCDWCESPEGMAEIMGFLREAAEERGLPFVDMAARLLVKRAIANARKAEARRARGSSRHD